MTKQANKVTQAKNKKATSRNMRILAIGLGINGIVLFIFGSLVVSFDTFAGGSYSPEQQGLGDFFKVGSLFFVIVAFFLFVVGSSDKHI